LHPAGGDLAGLAIRSDLKQISLAGEIGAIGVEHELHIRLFFFTYHYLDNYHLYAHA